MEKKLAIIHTTPVTIDSLKALASKYLPDYKVINIVDDSILPELGENGGDITAVQDRLIQYAKNAEHVGADVILNACSSVGEVVQHMAEAVHIPIIRIDKAMAEVAVQNAGRIGVVATLATTLNPTLRLIENEAKRINKEVDIESALAEEAYKCLINGDSKGHDRILAEVLSALGDRTDIVVLAQASMARVVESLPVEKRHKFITSPELGMERLAQTMKGTG
ncbi:aspartate/glutamate racemase [Pullulanibacillus pueri]|uniref:Asp/Glu racemase n=1 Tax=Pullulanibacillus pueri TaxID=1437324 RepID=A0A8J3EMI3_9BACL|nr:aspartate/glutamate racemase family protein [Pullulanibacillus pueri]MBM7682918.1 aspartate/glutamate racemase [Pullulanibacillus pueri]GGH84791.1 hypothetical protein GCM10007096_28690 [Pullulanibacillus pueri]